MHAFKPLSSPNVFYSERPRGKGSVSTSVISEVVTFHCTYENKVIHTQYLRAVTHNTLQFLDPLH